MKKYLVVLFLIIGSLQGFGTGCSSSDSASEDSEAAESEEAAISESSEETEGEEATAESSGEGEDTEFIDEGSEEGVAEGDVEGGEEGDIADGGEDEGGEEGDVAAGDEGDVEGGEEGDVAAGDEGDGDTDEGMAASEPEEVDDAMGEGTDVAQSPTEGEGSTDVASGEPVTQDSAAVTEPMESTEPAMEGDTASMGASVAASYIPVKRIASSPFNKNGALMNTVYIARPGDDIASISQKIYGSDRSGDLLSWNGHLGRGVKVGDKVYYNSGRRPTDNARMLTYYEDVGIEPQIHPAKAGDNIRTVAKSLLGHERSWMEVWATNPEVESKDVLEADANLRYWSDSASAGVPSPIADSGQAPPPVAPDMMADPGNLPMDPIAGGTEDPLASPPGSGDLGTPLPDMTAPPPPTVGATNTPGSSPSGPNAVAEAGDDDMTTTLALVGVVLLAGVGLMVVMKKNRSRRMDLTQTQI